MPQTPEEKKVYGPKYKLFQNVWMMENNRIQLKQILGIYFLGETCFFYSFSDDLDDANWIMENRLFRSKASLIKSL